MRLFNGSLSRKITIGVITTFVILIMNFILVKTLPSYIPMSLFLSAVVIASWCGGSFAGIIACILGAIVEITIFPHANLKNEKIELTRLVVYLFQGIGISFIFGDFHLSQMKVVESEKELAAALIAEQIVRSKLEVSLKELRISQDQTCKEHEAARNANRIKTLFLAHMSHEIRTPLTAILGFTELLKTPQLEEEERLKYLSVVERTGNSLRDIINDILDISKVEAGHFEIEAAPFDLSQLLTEINAVLSLKCLEKGLQLNFISQSEIPQYIRADSARLRQILVNLIGNSIKFTEKGHIRICYHTTDNHLVFRVEDTGIGITAEQSKNLFKNFSQGDNSISRKFAGTGLGLSLSQKFARMMGGDIELISSQSLVGSIFELTVQYQKVTAASEEIIHVPIVHELNLENKIILIVDDSLDNLMLLESILSKVGCRVHSAANGAEAVLRATQEKYDLILMDMQMPVMDGYDATKQLRLQNCATPIIAITANAFKEDRLKCIDAGCNDYLVKPLHKPRLFQVLKVYC